MSDTTKQAADFICGAGPDENGRWFEQAAQEEKGNFWWRRYVRKIMDDYHAVSARVTELEDDRACLIIARDMMGNKWGEEKTRAEAAEQRAAELEAKLAKAETGFGHIVWCSDRDSAASLARATLAELKGTDT